ncbi:hypothetical protein EDB84DRAFT_1573941 [Lactarius hengduanensis]|nr:hypothetical protein EDB84DRAFT_1573941 [Lactarius hengduanensis]
MQPLSAVNAPELDDTIRIFGSGTVTSVEPDPPSFLIHATQYIDGGQSSDNIAVRGRLDNNPKWQNPAERIPQPNLSSDGAEFSSKWIHTLLPVDLLSLASSSPSKISPISLHPIKLPPKVCPTKLGWKATVTYGSK